MFVYLVHAASQIICGFVNASVAKDGYCGRCGFDFDSKWQYACVSSLYFLHVLYQNLLKKTQNKQTYIS